MERELNIILRLTDRASRGLKSSTGVLQQFGRVGSAAGRLVGNIGGGLLNMGRMALRAATSLRTLVAVIASFLALRQAVRWFSSIVSDLDRMSKLSRELGFTTEFLSALQANAQFAGVSVEQLNNAMTRLNVNIGAATQGAAEQQRVFRELGVSFRGRSTQDVLLDVAVAMGRVGSEAERARIATQLFGRQAGPRLLVLLAQGRAGIEGFISEAERLGAVVSTESAVNAERLSDAWTRIRLQVAGIMREFAARHFEDIAKALEFVSGLIAQFSDDIKDALTWVVDWLTYFAGLVSGFFDNVIWDMLQFKFPRAIQVLAEIIFLEARLLLARIMEELKLFILQINSEFEMLPAGIRKLLKIGVGGSGFLESDMQGHVTLARQIENAYERLNEIVNDRKIWRFIQMVTGRPEAPEQTAMDEAVKKARTLRDIFRDLTTGIGEGLTGAFDQIKRDIMDVAGFVQNVGVTAFNNLRSSAVSAVESVLDGSAKMSDALRAFGRAIISTFINMMAQMIVMIPIFLLFNVLSGGGIAALGAANVVAALGQAAGAVSGFGGMSGGGGGTPSGGQTLTRDSGPVMPPSGGGGAATQGTTINVERIEAMDAQSFAAFVNGPNQRRAIGGAVQDEMGNNLSMRQTLREAVRA